MPEPGVTGGAGRQYYGRGHRAPSPSRQLSSRRLRPPPPATRPRDAKSTCQGRVWESRPVSSREPAGLPKSRREEHLLLPTPVRTHSFPLSSLASRLVQPWKTGNDCAEGKKDLYVPWPLLRTGSFREWGVGKKACNSQGIFQLITSPLRRHQPFSPICSRLRREEARKAWLLLS